MAKVKAIRLSSVQQISLVRAPVESERLRGRAHQARNARLAFANPLCDECLKEGRVQVVEEWDHVVPLADGGADHEDNLQGLCHDHHAAKSAREAAARAQRAPPGGGSRFGR